MNTEETNVRYPLCGKVNLLRTTSVIRYSSLYGQLAQISEERQSLKIIRIWKHEAIIASSEEGTLCERKTLFNIGNMLHSFEPLPSTGAAFDNRN